MLKKITFTSALIVISFVFGGVCSWVIQNAIYRPTINPPPRVSGIPENAIWSGGIDGGNWFICSANIDSTYNCSVFDDRTGLLILDGNFRLTAYIRDDLDLIDYGHISEDSIVLQRTRLVKIKK